MLDHYHDDDYDNCWIWFILADYDYEDFQTLPPLDSVFHFGRNIFNDDCEDFDRFWLG